MYENMNKEERISLVKEYSDFVNNKGDWCWFSFLEWRKWDKEKQQKTLLDSEVVFTLMSERGVPRELIEYQLECDDSISVCWDGVEHHIKKQKERSRKDRLDKVGNSVF